MSTHVRSSMNWYKKCKICMVCEHFYAKINQMTNEFSHIQTHIQWTMQ